MPLRAVHFAADCFYHIYNRGSEKRTIFLSDRDYINFLERLKENSSKYSIDILCYCLMPNHFHLLLRQTSDISLVQFMNAIQLGHAKYFNTKYERVGPLFQGRFKAILIESESYLLQVSAYIHRNPITKLVDSGNPEGSRNQTRDMLRSFPYSSYWEYIRRENMLCRPKIILEYFSKTVPGLTYEAFVENFLPDYDIHSPFILDEN